MRTSNGGWNSLVIEDTESPMTSFPTVSTNAARARRKNNRILATLPPLTKTLDKEVLDEMRKIIHRYVMCFKPLSDTCHCHGRHWNNNHVRLLDTECN